MPLDPNAVFGYGEDFSNLWLVEHKKDGTHGGSQTVLPASNGTDDTAALNAILALAGNIAGKQQASYIISSPLVLYSNTTLDMTNCTITLKAGSNCNMVNTSVHGLGRNVTDAVTTAASTTLTSATAAFTNADIGTGITVSGAGVAGATLFTTIASVTNGTTVVLATAALATVAAATAGIGARCSDIRVVGGLWDRGANNGATGTLRHSLVFRKVDRLSVRDMAFKSSNGKFQVLVQSCTDFLVDNHDMRAVSSDGIHIEGPAQRGQVSNIRGSCGDDMVALTPKDWTGYTWGDEGDITDILIDGIFGNVTTKAITRVLGGTGLNCKRIIVRNIFGSTIGGPCVEIGDDTGDAATIGGLLDQVSVDNVRAVSTNNSGSVVKVSGTNVKKISVSRLIWDAGTATTQNAVLVSPSGVSVQALTLDGLHVVNACANDGAGVLVVAGCTVTDLSVTGVTGSWTGTSGGAVVVVGGTINDCAVSNFTGTVPINHHGIVKLLDATAAAICRRIAISNISATFGASGALVRAINASHTVTKVEIADVVVSQLSWLVDSATTIAVGMSAVSTDSGVFNIRTGGALTARVDQSCDLTTTNTLTGTLRSIGFGWRGDVALLVKTAGDCATNTNASSLPGAGVAVCDGTNWRRIDTGAVKTGTAVLVAGTVTVADTAITANSIIRVSRKTMGGTAGALYISALTASTSFAITSTNGADTSTVYYEIVNY